MFRSLCLCLVLPVLASCGGDDDDNGNQNPDAAQNDANAIDAPMFDAAPLDDCVADLGTVADGSSADENNPNVVISEVDPGAFIEVYNAGNQAVILSATGYFWCNNRAYPSFASLDIEVAAGGLRTIPWPGGGGDEAGGDVSIYSRGQFTGGANNILDYVCWGDPASGGATRLADAVGVAKWNGPCAPAIGAGGSIARLPGQDGTESGDYSIEATPSPEDCK